MKNVIIALLVIAIACMLIDNINDANDNTSPSYFIFNGPGEEIPDNELLSINVIDGDTAWLSVRNY